MKQLETNHAESQVLLAESRYQSYRLGKRKTNLKISMILRKTQTYNQSYMLFNEIRNLY